MTDVIRRCCASAPDSGKAQCAGWEAVLDANLGSPFVAGTMASLGNAYQYREWLAAVYMRHGPTLFRVWFLTGLLPSQFLATLP